MRVVGYIRVSSTKQEQEGTSLGEQRERIEQWCADNRHQLIGVASEARSGAVQGDAETSIDHRPKLQAIIAQAAAGEIDALVVSRFDRLSRDHATNIIIRRRLASYGVQLVSTAEDNGDGKEARLQANVVAAVAEYEREAIVEKLMNGKIARRKEGRHAEGRIPYGYASIGQGRLEPMKERASVVRDIFTQAAAGDSSGMIARRLQAHEVPAPRGDQWRASGVRSILKNPAYYGERYGHAKAHAEIVPRRTWNRAQATLDANRRNRQE